MSHTLTKDERRWMWRAVLLSLCGGVVVSVPVFPPGWAGFVADSVCHGMAIMCVVLCADTYRLRLEGVQIAANIAILESEIKLARLAALRAVAPDSFHIDDTRSWS